MYKISSEQLNALANYLGQKPYVEAKPYIDMLASLEKVEGVELAEVKKEEAVSG